MSLRIRVLAALVLATAVSVIPASADSVRITFGSFVYPATGGAPVISLNGEGFTFTSNISRTDAVIAPFDQCGVPQCTAGTTVHFDTQVPRVAFRDATLTYQGITYNSVNGFDTFDATMSLTWYGSVVIPDGFAGGPLTSQFALLGFFLYPIGNNQYPQVDLSGAGFGTVTLVPHPGTPGAFRASELRFDFDNGAPTPEPASLLLLGTGLAGLAAARRKRSA